MVVLFFFFYVDVYDFLSIVKCICLFSLLTIHDKALHDKRYQLWNRKKWLGTRVMFEFSFTSKILRLIIGILFLLNIDVDGGTFFFPFMLMSMISYAL